MGVYLRDDPDESVARSDRFDVDEAQPTASGCSKLVLADSDNPHGDRGDRPDDRRTPGGRNGRLHSGLARDGRAGLLRRHGACDGRTVHRGCCTFGAQS